MRSGDLKGHSSMSFAVLSRSGERDVCSILKLLPNLQSIYEDMKIVSNDLRRIFFKNITSPNSRHVRTARKYCLSSIRFSLTSQRERFCIKTFSHCSQNCVSVEYVVTLLGPSCLPKLSVRFHSPPLIFPGRHFAIMTNVASPFCQSAHYVASRTKPFVLIFLTDTYFNCTVNRFWVKPD
jgi:hypothetical protein